jgi:imidazolonepropionase-like amidohydrolase
LTVAALGAAGAGPEGEPAPPERVVVKAARVVVSPGKTIPRGVIVLEDGKIAAVGTDLGAPQGARVLDYGDATVCAGFVNCHTAAGAENEITDTTEAFTPAVRAADAVRERRRAFVRAAEAGLTTAALSPDGRNLAGGVAALVKTGQRARVFRVDAYLKLSLAPNAFQDDRFPTSLSAGLTALNRLWREAGGDPARVKDPSLAPLARAKASKDFRPWIEAADPACVRQVIALAKDVGCSPVLVATGDLTEAAAEIAEAKIPVVLPVLTLGSTPRERRAPAALVKAGVEIAFCTMGTRFEGGPASLRLGAILAAASGLDRFVAFAAITTTPAKLLKCESQVGAVEVGRDADLVVLGGDPMNLSAPILAVFCGGELSSGRSRQ